MNLQPDDVLLNVYKFLTISLVDYDIFSPQQSEKEVEEADPTNNLPESSSENLPESHTNEDEADSLSKSTETASTIRQNVKLEKKSSEDSNDKTDDELEEMETETHDEGEKPIKMEEVGYDNQRGGRGCHYYDRGTNS